MCSRYELKAPAKQINERFCIDVPVLPNKTEVRPTDLGFIIGAKGRIVQGWGLRPAWGGGPLINARCESLAEKPSFRNLLNNRVLVPASHWWEWTRDAKDRPDRKMRLAPVGKDLFAFAGLSDGEHFTIITCDAVPDMAEMNDRMPVILSAEAEAHWLDSSLPYEQVKGSLQPFTGPLAISEDADDTPQFSLF